MDSEGRVIQLSELYSSSHSSSEWKQVCSMNHFKNLCEHNMQFIFKYPKILQLITILIYLIDDKKIIEFTIKNISLTINNIYI